MELLNPSLPLPHVHDEDGCNGFAPPPDFLYRFNSNRSSATSDLPRILEEDSDKVHVAVGKSIEKAVILLQWSFNRFPDKEICILHVHQPSSTIPTLLGKLPASQANKEVLFAHRKQERERTVKLLETYMSICHATKVKLSICVVEADQVQKGIIDSVNRYGIRKLVMGAEVDKRMMVKKNSSKANYAAKNAPSFCEIWCISKGKQVWIREASESPYCLHAQPEITAAGNLRFRSFRYGDDKLNHTQLCRSKSARAAVCTGDSLWIQSETRNRKDSSPSSLSLNGVPFSHHDEGKERIEEEELEGLLAEAKMNVEDATNELFSELSKRKKLEQEAMEARSKTILLESALAREIEFRNMAEDSLRTTIEEQEKLLNEKNEVCQELERIMRNVALLDSRAREANRRQDEVFGELSLIQASVATISHEKQQIRRQKLEALRWLDRWKSNGQHGSANCNGFLGFFEEFPELAEFSLADIENATCNFSESFKIGKGGYGCVYKGELLGRTVAIKKLHPHNTQGPSEFYQEVKVLGSLQHRHLVTLLGVCPEACSLVYEYQPNGSLQDHLSQKGNISPMTWDTRARIIVEIASALSFLHSSKPETIVHGDLKPENILLDSSFCCKIGDFGLCRLLTEDTLYSASFNRNTEPKGTFKYMDPECQRSGILTPKSDVYSFGLIILQLVTGKPPVGLAGEVRKAVSSGKLSSIVDSSAGDWPKLVVKRLVEIGLQCCELNGRARPDMTPALIRELELLHVSEERPVPPFFLCPIFQEIMHDPQVAADGFTYEGEAIRGWLENGHQTSPMTNLKLSHLLLTPNHALRFAIQNWLCKS